MLDRDQLETFATVAEEQSFERAASVLNITRGAVSQRIRSLEESLATVLLMREKPIVPTPAGEVMLRHVKALRLLEGAAHAGTRCRPPGPHAPVPLAIAVNADSLATWFPVVLQRPAAAAPRGARSGDRRPGPHRWPARPRRGHRLHLDRGQGRPPDSSPSSWARWSTAATRHPRFVSEFFPEGLSVPAVSRRAGGSLQSQGLAARRLPARGTSASQWIGTQSTTCHRRWRFWKALRWAPATGWSRIRKRSRSWTTESS